NGKPAGSVGTGVGMVDVASAGALSDAAAADDAQAASHAPDATRPLAAEPAAQPAPIATAASASPSRTAPTPPRVVRSKSLMLLARVYPATEQMSIRPMIRSVRLGRSVDE